MRFIIQKHCDSGRPSKKSKTKTEVGRFREAVT